jgi:hypothetical protein
MTASAYPAGALDVLIRMRRASSIVRQHHRRVVLAWLLGAEVGDGDPISDKGLRWSLLKILDEVHWKASLGIRRPHRKSDPDWTTLIGPIDRGFLKEAAEGMITGQSVPPVVGEYAGEVLASVPPVRKVLSREEFVDKLPAAPLGTALGSLLSGRDPDSGAPILFSVAAAQGLVSDAPREHLDMIRDTVRRKVEPDWEPESAEDVSDVLSWVIGLLIGNAAASGRT